MSMFKTCSAKIRKINPAICSQRTVKGSNKTFKCTGHCAGCYGKCRPINARTAASNGIKVCEIDPDYMYVHVAGLHGNQMDRNQNSPGYGQLKGNENGDFFWWKKTLLAYNSKFGMRTFETWRGKDNLENHDESKVIGDIPDVWPVIKDKSIDMLIRTSKKRAWAICESIKKGSVTDTSMGILVGHSFCTVCGNKATTEEEWCDDLKYHKGQFLHPDYLKTGQLRDKWSNGVWVAEDNRDGYGLEISWITVGEGADPGAIVKNLIAGADDAIGKQFAKKKNNIMDMYWDQWGNKYRS